ncbi:MAG: 16S rRNA (uracil(1498)-N(3))-methyltransferase [Clostridia bacterium]|nr:16S rRNA (uracil(1498)-N(3))-methyltransferase [Clostridia bacterium]
MRRFFIEKENILNQTVKIAGEEFNHLSKVLRLKEGGEIICIVGDGFNYHCQIVGIDKKEAQAKILNKTKNLSDPKIIIDVFQGIPKGEKINFVVQKLTELGANNVTFFESDFTIAKGNTDKLIKLNRIAKEACKQCRRSKPLELKPFIWLKNIENFLNEYDMILYLYENADENNNISNLVESIRNCKKVAVVVGAEGGFSLKENVFLGKLNLTQISLGERILRTETACIAVVGFISLLTNN